MYPDWITNQIQPVSNLWIHPQHSYVSKIINFAHLNQTITFVSILNICIQIGSTIKSNLYPIHEFILNIHNQDNNPTCIKFIIHNNIYIPHLTFVSILYQLSYISFAIFESNLCSEHSYQYLTSLSNQIQPVSNSWNNPQHSYPFCINIWIYL